MPFLFPSFTDFMLPSGHWDIHLLSDIFPASVVPHFFSIRCPHPDDVADNCCWRWDRQFSKLMTNVERTRRGISDSLCCDLCDGLFESVLHVLRDCPPARVIWDTIVQPSVRMRFFSLDVSEWLMENISSVSTSNPYKLAWNLLFSSCSWQIWKIRNDRVFANINHDPSIVLSRCLSWATNYANLYHPHYSAVNAVSGLGTIGGVLRDSAGSWISGFCRNIGFSDALTAELWAIHDGLELAWNNGFFTLQVRSDCSMVISLITNPNTTSSSHTLVRTIANLCRRAWSLEYTWVPRETNRPADFLAKHVPPDDFSFLMFEQPPCFITDLLSRDVHGSSYCKVRSS
ncbi:hypothetical protein V6N11_056745 [Hibiscus sabdariffa]|uniref:RNase H type-1 domain-containing protein n=1 Tax=Hibiscus sabdariffa TaxID=183260 RepID=A0ABR2T5P6_9ROSI